MSSPIINFTKPKRILLLIDLNPLLIQSPNPNYINSILTISKTILSFDSLFAFKFFISSLSPLRSATALRRILPDHNSLSLSFNSPSQTLTSLSKSLDSISGLAELSYSCSSCSNTVSSLLQLGNEYDWQLDIDEGNKNIADVDYYIRSNLIVLLSPVCDSVNALAEYLCFDVNDDCVNNLDLYRATFRDSFRVVNNVFDTKDIHFCWIDVGSDGKEEGFEKCDVIGDEIRNFGWGFCLTDMIVLGSALVSFGLVYPSIVVSSKVIDECRLSKRIRGQLSLEILDVSGKPLECKCCDLELLPMRVSSNKVRTREVGKDVGFVDKFMGGLNDGSVKMHVTAVRQYTECESFKEFSSDSFLVQTAVSGKKGKDGLDNCFAARVLELLAGGNLELFEKHKVPIWQIFLGFLSKEGYCALISLSNSKGDSYMGILKPFTIHSAVIMLVDNNHYFVQKAGGANLFMNETGSQGDTDSRKVSSLSGKYVHESDGKRRKMKKHAHRDLTWSSFCKAAYECLDVDLAEVYFANCLKRSKKLKFLKCWMNQVKNHTLAHENMSHGSRQRVSDSNQQKETDTNENLAASYQEGDEPLSMHICSDQSRILDDAAFTSCSGTSEAFFSNLPKMIQDLLESDGVDLKILAERLVRSSIYWLGQKHETMENLDESCTMQVFEIIKLLLRDPKDLKEQKDNNAGCTSEYIVREYELQVLLRLEILQSEYAGSITGFMKMKFVKQICSLLEIIQYLVEGGFHGDVSLYDYVERTIKSRYLQNLGDVVDQIYDQMDLLPFGEEDEVQALMFNSEDSNQSWREKHDRQDVTASKMIKDSLSLEDESSHPLENVDTSHEEQAKDDHSRKLNEARERRERARRFVSFTSRMPDLQRVWAPKQPKSMKVKPESKRKKQRRVSYSVVCETPLIGNEPSCSTGQNKGERSKACNPVSKALFQDDR